MVIPEKEWELRKSLATEIREKILRIVSTGVVDVNQLAKKLSISAPAARKHVDVLEKADLIKSERIFFARGKPRNLLPSVGIFREGLELPFLQDRPSYTKAKKLIEAYRATAKMAIPSVKNVEAIYRNVQELYDEEFKKIEEARGWFTRYGVLFGWCLIFLSHFVEKVPLTTQRKKYPDIEGVLVGYNIDIHELMRGIRSEHVDVPGTVHIEFLLMRRELEEENTPLAKIALQIIYKYESKISNLPTKSGEKLESSLEKLMQMIVKRSAEALKRYKEAKEKKFKVFTRTRPEEWDDLWKDFVYQMQIGELFNKSRSRKTGKEKEEGGENA